MMLVTNDRVWVSPGQWGSVAFFAFLIACLGGLVVMRAARSDVTLTFLAAWLALIFGRSLWLGRTGRDPVHRLQNGALLLFAFFMISDPRTTPDSRAGRIVFALLVAVGAWIVQFNSSAPTACFGRLPSVPSACRCSTGCSPERALLDRPKKHASRIVTSSICSPQSPIRNP
jgi:Na+-translocating ferredoxin:NAD+ oxidoreductase RnfD subunit